MSIRVYIVCKGERGEGHDPVSAHTSFIGAHQHAKKLGAPQVMPQQSEGQWMGTVNTTDEFWIVRLAVDDVEPAPPKAFVKPRGICTGCHKEMALTTRGVVQGHHLPRGRDREWRGPCSGSRKHPAVRS